MPNGTEETLERRFKNVLAITGDELKKMPMAVVAHIPLAMKIYSVP